LYAPSHPDAKQFLREARSEPQLIPLIHTLRRLA
jgi:hypothetical protein